MRHLIWLCSVAACCGRLAFDASGLAVPHRVHHGAVAVSGVIAVLSC
jgi:hypothetical protein